MPWAPVWFGRPGRPGRPGRQTPPPRRVPHGARLPHPQPASIGNMGGCLGRRKAGRPRRGGGAAGHRPAADPLPGIARQRPGGRSPPAAPARTQRQPAATRQRMSVGHTAVTQGEQEGRGGHVGGRRLGAKRPERAHPGPRAPGALFCLAGRGQPCGPPPAAKRRRPPSAGFSANAKKAAKSPTFRPTRPRPVHHPEKGGSDREPSRNSYPKATAALFRRGLPP